jgi:hypothetical protein
MIMVPQDGRGGFVVNEEPTGRRLVPTVGYVVVKPISPATLRIASDETSGSRLEDIPYIVKDRTPPPLLVREIESSTA